ncbi:MAG: hypothetical protein V7L22_11220 [Nostoc sp.]|uniref:hypothetical protein n=1 Tax=Nostoc sp. TaxID=1180 RepID=UPI002FF70EA0
MYNWWIAQRKACGIACLRHAMRERLERVRRSRIRYRYTIERLDSDRRRSVSGSASEF